MPAQILCFLGYALAAALLMRFDALPLIDQWLPLDVDLRRDLVAAVFVLVMIGWFGVVVHFQAVPAVVESWRQARLVQKGRES